MQVLPPLPWNRIRIVSILVKDAGDNYRYERGEYEVIKFFWSEKEQTLKKYNAAGEYEGTEKVLKIKKTILCFEKSAFSISQSESCIVLDLI